MGYENNRHPDFVPPTASAYPGWWPAEQASIIEVGSSASSILGFSRKIRAIIKRCICRRKAQKDTYCQFGELQVDKAACLGHQLYFSLSELPTTAHADTI